MLVFCLSNCKHRSEDFLLESDHSRFNVCENSGSHIGLTRVPVGHGAACATNKQLCASLLSCKNHFFHLYFCTLVNHRTKIRTIGLGGEMLQHLLLEICLYSFLNHNPLWRDTDLASVENTSINNRLRSRIKVCISKYNVAVGAAKLDYGF